MWRWVVLVFLVVALLLPVGGVAQAETSVEVVVTASGYICEAPGGFTLTYVSDYEVGLTWTKGEDAVNTMIRAKYGSYPEDLDDGYQVYYGNGSNCTDTALSLASPDIIYYAAWAENANGVWNPLFSSSTTEGFMSASFLFLGLIILAVLLTFIALKVNLILFRLAASLGWLSLGIWLLIGDVTNLALSDTWTQVLGFLFLVMVIAPLTLQMVTEIKREEGGKKWSEWGRKPSKLRETRRERSDRIQSEYREQLKGIRRR